jgi:hypothetical protein
MNFARPRGVVLDGALTHGLPFEQCARGFEGDEIYIRGVADSAPHSIWVRPDWTSIPDPARQPPNTHK